MRRAAILVLCGLSFLGACSRPPPFREYRYPAWGFAVSFRAQPKETDYPATAGGAHSVLVESAHAGRDHLVNVIDGSGSTKSEDQALSAAPAALARYVGGTLGPMTYAASGKAMGREFLLSRPGRPPSRVRIFVWHKHLYELIAESSLGPDDPENEKFLTSFRLT
jgi:hypothetical protein